LLVTKASLHYHFPSKVDLGVQLIARYRSTFNHALEEIDARVDDAAEKLRRYVALYEQVIVQDRMCLCGMFAAEYATLPEAMQRELRAFFDENEAWLTAVLKAGKRTGRLSIAETPAVHARVLVDILEGAMLVARTYGNVDRFRSAARHALAELGT
jgi:TetR/AcrR family transcriptional regulator, transcriptional repressor for nem operon